MGITRRISRSALLGALCASMPAHAQSANTVGAAPARALAEDLHATLALSGVRCRGITEALAVRAQVYDLTCLGGTRYRVDASQGNGVGVLRIPEKRTATRSTPTALAASDAPRRLGFGASSVEHVVYVARRLFAIITLTGNPCYAISFVERRASDDHVVSCSDGLVYHVYIGAGGGLAVDRRRERDQHP